LRACVSSVPADGGSVQASQCPCLEVFDVNGSPAFGGDDQLTVMPKRRIIVTVAAAPSA
jgi:hypothetical protein